MKDNLKIHSKLSFQVQIFVEKFPFCTLNNKITSSRTSDGERFRLNGLGVRRQQSLRLGRHYAGTCLHLFDPTIFHTVQTLRTLKSAVSHPQRARTTQHIQATTHRVNGRSAHNKIIIRVRRPTAGLDRNVTVFQTSKTGAD